MRGSRRFGVIVLPVFVALAQMSSALVLIGAGDAHETSLTGRPGRLDLVLHHHGVPRSSHHHDGADWHAGASSDTHHDDEDGTEPDHVVSDVTDPGLLREAGFTGANQGPLCIVVGGNTAAGGVISSILQAPRGPASGPAPPLRALATIILRI